MWPSPFPDGGHMILGGLSLPLLHVTVPASFSTLLVDGLFLRFRLVDPALFDMLDVA